MKIAVCGLYHLGAVTATSLAHVGYEVVGLDGNVRRIEHLRGGQPPVYEPGLQELLHEGLSSRSLRFTTNSVEACEGASIVWITHDTPVGENDEPNVEFVAQEVSGLFPHLGNNTLVLISSQVAVGTTRRLQKLCDTRRPGAGINFAYIPENLRLGQALSVFAGPDRVIAGIPNDSLKAPISALLKPFTNRIEWMSVESAEMTKHALNAFLGMSIAFANEVAALCERVGADAKEVERGLKSEVRVGPRAYVSPGAAFAGGTLGRDLRFLEQLGRRYALPMHLISSILTANEAHRQWARRQIAARFADLNGTTVGIWGLSYKAGTSTLRRSPGIELASWLVSAGARVNAFDPVVRMLPPEVIPTIGLVSMPLDAINGAAVLVVETAWEEFRTISSEEVAERMIAPRVVLDASRSLVDTLGTHNDLLYVSVGDGRLREE